MEDMKAKEAFSCISFIPFMPLFLFSTYLNQPYKPFREVFLHNSYHYSPANAFRLPTTHRRGKTRRM